MCASRALGAERWSAMYLVVSEWEPMPGKEEQFKQAGMATGARLRDEPGVEFMHAFQNDDGKVVTVVGYSDEATYRRLIDDPNGVFAREHERNRVEEYGRWLGSKRGEAIDVRQAGLRA